MRYLIKKEIDDNLEQLRHEYMDGRITLEELTMSSASIGSLYPQYFIDGCDKTDDIIDELLNNIIDD